MLLYTTKIERYCLLLLKEKGYQRNFALIILKHGIAEVESLLLGEFCGNH